MNQNNVVDQTPIRYSAERVGDHLIKQLEEASLLAQTKLIVELYFQGRNWIDVGGLHASPSVRRRLLIRLANALLLDSEEKRIPNQGLDDALNLPGAPVRRVLSRSSDENF